MKKLIINRSTLGMILYLLFELLLRSTPVAARDLQSISISNGLTVVDSPRLRQNVTFENGGGTLQLSQNSDAGAGILSIDSNSIIDSTSNSYNYYASNAQFLKDQASLRILGKGSIKISDWEQLTGSTATIINTDGADFTIGTGTVATSKMTSIAESQKLIIDMLVQSNTEITNLNLAGELEIKGIDSTSTIQSLTNDVNQIGQLSIGSGGVIDLSSFIFKPNMVVLQDINNNGELNIDVARGGYLKINDNSTYISTSFNTVNLSGWFVNKDKEDEYSIENLNIVGSDSSNAAHLSDIKFINNLELNNNNYLVLESSTDYLLNPNQEISINAGSGFEFYRLESGVGLKVQNSGSKITLGFGEKENIGINKPEINIFGNLVVRDIAAATGTGISNAGSISNINCLGGVSGSRYSDTLIVRSGDITDTIHNATKTELDTHYKLETQSQTLDYYLVLSNSISSTSEYDVIVNAKSGSFENADKLTGGKNNIVHGVAKTLDRINQNSAKYDHSTQQMMTELGNLSSTNDLVQAELELSGIDSQSSTSSMSISGVNQSVTALRNQMTVYRMGNLSAAMASTFSGSGATASLTDIANPDELSIAYSSSDNAMRPELTDNYWGGFIKTYGGYGEQGSDPENGYAGYESMTVGAIVGLDYAISRELRLGGLLAYSYSHSNIYNNLGEGRDNMIRTGVFGSYLWDNFFFDLSPTIGVHMLKSSRKINTVLGETAIGERTAFDFNTQSTLGYNFKLPSGLLLSPSYNLSYTYYSDPGYTESGAGGGNLKVNSYSSQSILQEVNIRIGKLFKINSDVQLLPELWAGWRMEYLNTGGELRAAFAGVSSESFTNKIRDAEKHRAAFGAGLTGLISNNISIFGRYDHEISKSSFNATITAGIKIFF